MTVNKLPYRFREESFRRYENDIKLIIDSWPLAVKFSPPNVETYSNRLRDAMTSLHINKWHSAIDQAKFDEKYNQIVVSVQHPHVIAGSAQSVKPSRIPDAVRICPPAQTISDSLSDPIINPSPELLLALIVIHHYRLKREPTMVRFTEPQTLLPGDWDMRYDIAIDQLPDGTYKIL